MPKLIQLTVEREHLTRLIISYANAEVDLATCDYSPSEGIKAKRQYDYLRYKARAAWSELETYIDKSVDPSGGK